MSIDRQGVPTVNTLPAGQAGLEKLCAFFYTRQYLVVHCYMSSISASGESAWQRHTIQRQVEFHWHAFKELTWQLQPRWQDLRILRQSQILFLDR